MSCSRTRAARSTARSRCARRSRSRATSSTTCSAATTRAVIRSRSGPGGSAWGTRPASTCRPWSVGDNVNLAVGQGDLQANPLQLAVAYATVANGGRVVQPHLAQRTEDADGAAVQEFNIPARRRVKIKPENRAAILDGLHQAARRPGGTSYGVFANFPIEIAGKTGTAE